MSIQTHLENTASKLVLSDIEKNSIATSISTLKYRLSDYFGTEIVQQIQFGSSTRGTILPRKADPNSDIDYMIVFNNTIGYKPQTFIDKLKRFATAKYSTSEIKMSHPTVVLSLNHIKFDLVPAYKQAYYTTYYIPAPKSDYTEWISTDPNGFNNQLTEKNKTNLFHLKPTIRLVKYWNAKNDYVYNSFELEKELAGKAYWSAYGSKQYFYEAMNGLQTWDLPQYKKDKVLRAQTILRQAKSNEDSGWPYAAEEEIKKIIPSLY